MTFGLIFWLFAGHFVSDYPLQSDWMAKAKNRHNPLAYIPARQTPQLIWPWVLTAHCATHAAAVALVTNNPLLGLCEFVAHVVIDVLKCENVTGIHTDQALHLLCKLAWAYVALS